MDRRRESEVCESVRELEEFDEGGGRACRSWVSVCGVVGRGRGAPEKKWSSAQTKDAFHAPQLFGCERVSHVRNLSRFSRWISFGRVG